MILSHPKTTLVISTNPPFWWKTIVTWLNWLNPIQPFFHHWSYTHYICITPSIGWLKIIDQYDMIIYPLYLPQYLLFIYLWTTYHWSYTHVKSPTPRRQGIGRDANHIGIGPGLRLIAMNRFEGIGPESGRPSPKRRNGRGHRMPCRMQQETWASPANMWI